MRPRPFISLLPLIALSALALVPACAQKAEFYSEAPALEAMRRPPGTAGEAETVASAGALQAEPAILLTIFLRHDQSKTLEEISKHLEATGFWKAFPPEGVEIESWKIMMGIGQVVTLRVPPSKLRDVNRAIETTAWGAYRTEFYATYDFMPIAQERRAKAAAAAK